MLWQVGGLTEIVAAVIVLAGAALAEVDEALYGGSDAASCGFKYAPFDILLET